MAKVTQITVKEVSVSALRVNGADYISITDIARQKNPIEPKDVVKNWMRMKNTLEYLGLWEQLNNPGFKGVEFDPLLKNAGSNAFTMSPSRWIEITGAIGIITKNGAGGGTFAQRDIASSLPVGFRLNLSCIWLKNFNVLKRKNKNFWAGQQNANWLNSITTSTPMPLNKT